MATPGNKQTYRKELVKFSSNSKEAGRMMRSNDWLRTLLQGSFSGSDERDFVRVHHVMGPIV